MKKLSENFIYIIYVLGNNEYYYSGDPEKKNMDELFQTAKKLETEIKNLHILDRSCIIINDVCIIGCTLWSYTSEVPNFIVRIHEMNVCKYNKMHTEDLKYIKKMINYCKNKQLKCFVVTHHPPTFDVSFYKKKDNYRYKSLYGNNMDYLLSSEYVNTWLCGHVHVNFDYTTPGGTRLVSNQKGKVKDNITDFSKNKIISL